MHLTIDESELAANRAELQGQITHPVEEYQPGSERLERLYAAMAQQQRYQWPNSLEIN
jgi:hypothetical protein